MTKVGAILSNIDERKQHQCPGNTTGHNWLEYWPNGSFSSFECELKYFNYALIRDGVKVVSFAILHTFLFMSPTRNVDQIQGSIPFAGVHTRDVQGQQRMLADLETALDRPVSPWTD